MPSRMLLSSGRSGVGIRGSRLFSMGRHGWGLQSLGLESIGSMVRLEW